MASGDLLYARLASDNVTRAAKWWPTQVIIMFDKWHSAVATPDNDYQSFHS